MSVFPKSHSRVLSFEMFFNLSGPEFEFLSGLAFGNYWKPTIHKEPLLLPEAVTIFFSSCKGSHALLKPQISFILYILAFLTLTITSALYPFLLLEV